MPKSSRTGFRWRASALRGFYRWSHGTGRPKPALIVVPALFNRLPAETVAMGWLNEIDALHTIRLRMHSVTRATGWDVFTFHTQHNVDHFYDTTITAVRETWGHEGSLSADSVNETKRRFGNIFDYHRIEPRLLENLVFQSSLMEWVATRAGDVPFEFRVVGTALYAALVWAGAVSFGEAVESAVKVGRRWDDAVAGLAQERAAQSVRGSTDAEIGWKHFEAIQEILEGTLDLSLAVARRDLPKATAPLRPFWFAPTMESEAVLVETARDAMLALEALNLMSWAKGDIHPSEHPVRGWLISPLHAQATSCRWSVYNYLLATPAAVPMFMDHIAAMGRAPLMALNPDEQNRLRLHHSVSHH